MQNFFVLISGMEKQAHHQKSLPSCIETNRTNAMYLMKIKGSGKIPDYLQIRDDEYTLVAYFRADRIEQGLARHKMEQYKEAIEACVEQIGFGEMKYLENIK